ncbi:MAG TPA: hypothetical protein VIZ65_10950 [Cellvibrionaceae bacterium]
MTEIGESVSVSIPKDDPDKELSATVLEVEFLKPFKDCINQATISPPHWPASVDSNGFSAKAVVLPFNKAPHKAKVKVKVTSKNYSGNGKLIGVLKGSVVFEGSISLSSGEHTVEVTSTSAPAYLSWVKGPISWGIEAVDKSLSIGRTPVEIFFVFSDPAALAFFAPKGVWIEALRFLFAKARLESLTDKVAAVAEVTRACFSLVNHKYDVVRGGAHYGGATTRFKLKAYMDGTSGEVNCYDQAYAVIVFSGALGVKTDGLFLRPFGFIRPVNLVGWGRCNNPFPKDTPIKDFLEVDPQSVRRSSFGNHMFCEFTAKIYDACAGPVRGNVDRAGYVKATIDDVMPPGYTVADMGTAAGMVNITSLGAGVASVE